MNAHRLMIAMLFVAALMALSCDGSKEIQLDSSSDIPAAQGTVKVSTSDNGNTKIDLVVEHLALPERVDPGATVYVVWAYGDEVGAQPQNLGALRVDSNLKGGMSVMTPLRSFGLYITAEPSQAVTMPSGKKLFYTSVAMN